MEKYACKYTHDQLHWQMVNEAKNRWLKSLANSACGIQLNYIENWYADRFFLCGWMDQLMISKATHRVPNENQINCQLSPYNFNSTTNGKLFSHNPNLVNAIFRNRAHFFAAGERAKEQRLYFHDRRRLPRVYWLECRHRGTCCAKSAYCMRRRKTAPFANLQHFLIYWFDTNRELVRCESGCCCILAVYRSVVSNAYLLKNEITARAAAGKLAFHKRVILVKEMIEVHLTAVREMKRPEKE